MSKGVLQSDGSRCYVGAGCRKHYHGSASETVLKNDLQEKLKKADQDAADRKTFERRRNALLVIREYGDDVVVANRGANAHVKPEVNLKDMQHGDVARGNCWAITNELIELVPAASFDASWTDEVSITTGSRGLDHTALLVGEKDSIYVVDYTARQFGQNLPFPFIAPVQEWKDALGKAYGKPFALVE